MYLVHWLLTLEDTWKFADESVEGKRAVFTLVDKRISWLDVIPKPDSSRLANILAALKLRKRIQLEPEAGLTVKSKSASAKMVARNI